MKKKIVIISITIILLLLIILTGGSFYMVDYALSTNAATRDVKAKMTRTRADYPMLQQWLDSIGQEGILCDTFMQMSSGERHHAIFVRDPRANGRTAIVVHGYHDAAVRMLPIASIYSRMGYNILLPDLHAHGLSEGDKVQMGWKDRKDVMEWMAAAERMFRTDGRQSAMVVHGVSMGAATTMCISGERQQPYVKCFVEDCGYTSAWDEFECQMEQQFGLPAFPLLYTSSALCRLQNGWWFGDASPLQQVARSTLPMLFIHGDRDKFVPTGMVHPLYEAKTQPVDSSGRVAKELWIVPNTDHAHAFKNHPEEYSARVRAFVGRWIDGR